MSHVNSVETATLAHLSLIVYTLITEK